MSLPRECAVALKEWATVLEAMSRGEQLVLIRKGGLIEPGSGFELVAKQFLFYPTFEHQAVNYLRPEYRRYFEDASARRSPEGRVRIDLVGVAVSSMDTHDPSVIEQLGQFHIYNEVFLHQRLKWQPDQPLVIVVVRTYRLAVPQVLSISPHYAGCKSWVDLDTPVPLEGATPVLDESAFRQRVDALTPLLPSLAQ